MMAACIAKIWTQIVAKQQQSNNINARLINLISAGG
jgi:hypothetical protein